MQITQFPNPIRSILRKVENKDKLNILVVPTHERYESQLSQTGHNFYALRYKGVKDWNTTYAPIPSNYHLLPYHDDQIALPLDIDFDLVLSQNKWGQFPVLKHISQALHLPFISHEHTLPLLQWSDNDRRNLSQMSGDWNTYISSYSISQWLPENQPNVRVITHGLDTSLFKSRGYERQGVILSVVNDWVNRDHCCNFQGWRRIVRDDLPVAVLGDTPGISKPANDSTHLAETYATCRIFLNTSTVSPVPMALMEAMASECAVVTTATCMIPEIIKNGINGFISNNEEELRNYCQVLLRDPELAKKLGENARKTILERYSLDRFTNQWNQLFDETRNFVYKG